MSDVRIALVCEGPTDRIVIEAALKAIVPCSFVLTVLQPEATRPTGNNGWSGVLKWCHASSLRYPGGLGADPTLASFDMLIIHLDADVAHKRYLDCGSAVAGWAQQFNWGVLPCNLPCPPAADTCAQLQQLISDWLGGAPLGRKTVLCIPSKSVGTWLAAAVLSPGHALLVNAECNLSLENQLAQLPRGQKIQKTVAAFRCHEQSILQNWAHVRAQCSQAMAFEQAVQAVALCT